MSQLIPFTVEQGCRCCVCRGIHCMMFHPTHFHGSDSYPTKDFKDEIERILEDLRCQTSTTVPEDE